MSEITINGDFTSVIEVSDFTTYCYHIDEDFDTKYFKVKVTSSDKTAESVPFAVNRTDDGYSVDFLDSDSLNDGEEVNVYVTDPLVEINTAENPYELTIKYTGTGYAEGNLSAGESGYANAIQSDAVLGKCVEISYESTCKIEECVLYYKIKDNYVENISGKYAAYTNELDGIKATPHKDHHICFINAHLFHKCRRKI